LSVPPNYRDEKERGFQKGKRKLKSRARTGGMTDRWRCRMIYIGAGTEKILPANSCFIDNRISYFKQKCISLNKIWGQDDSIGSDQYTKNNENRSESRTAVQEQLKTTESRPSSGKKPV
jgi:hypothetical protein